MPADSIRHSRQHKERGSFKPLIQMQSIVFGILRHVLGYAGAWATTNGFATADDVQTGTGAVVAIAAVAWSIVEKIRAKKAAA